MTTPAPSNDSPGQDNDLQTSPEEKSAVEPAEKGTADEAPEMVQKSKIPELDEKKEVIVDEKKSEGGKEKPTLGNSDVTREDVQEESVKAEEDTAAEPASGKAGERRKDEGVIEAQKQEETKSTGDK